MYLTAAKTFLRSRDRTPSDTARIAARSRRLDGPRNRESNRRARMRATGHYYLARRAESVLVKAREKERPGVGLKGIVEDGR